MKFNIILYITPWTRELYGAGRNSTSAQRFPPWAIRSRAVLCSASTSVRLV
jgi:hypothetical protein